MNDFFLLSSGGSSELRRRSLQMRHIMSHKIELSLLYYDILYNKIKYLHKFIGADRGGHTKT